jgi:transposase
MSNKRRSYKTYPREFKIEAVRLMEESDRPSAEIANELGVRRNMLYKWKEQLATKGEAAFSGKSGRKPKEQQSEMAKLKGENDRLREEVEILKKAAAYFARELK